jgi:hypothetical protein
MSASPYRSLERQIAANDAGTIYRRWEYGRRLLCDPSATTPDGKLRPGKTAELVEAAAREGVTLTEEEIRDRVDAARAYECESQILTAREAWDDWAALRNAGFPHYDQEPGEKSYDPRTAAEKVRQAEKQLALGEPDQLTLFKLFPGDQFSELSTLADLAKYAAESEDITRRFVDRNQKRAEYLTRLVKAAGGDMSKTWAEAQAVLDSREGGAE